MEKTKTYAKAGSLTRVKAADVPSLFHHTIKDIHRTHAWERQRSLLVRRSFTPVTAFVGEEVNAQSSARCYVRAKLLSKISRWEYLIAV